MKVELLNHLSDNFQKLIGFIKTTVNDEVFKKVENVIIADLHTLSNEVGSSDDQFLWDEVYVLYYIMSKLDIGNESFKPLYELLLSLDNYSPAVQDAYKKHIIGAYRQTVASIQKQSGGIQSTPIELISIQIFEQLDQAVGGAYALQYSTILYRFCEVIVKVDGKVSDEEEIKLKLIYEALRVNKSEDGSYKSKAAKDQIKSEDVKEENVNNNGNTAIDELTKLVGMDSVKKEIATLINFLKVQKQREAKGLPLANVSLHVVFTGNPGTGKTTVARLLASIYKSLGFLEKGHLVEIDRAGLVAGYVGQTAIKTTEIIDKAIGGVLFIDEAYTLSKSDSESDFGKEAIDTLLKRMEDNRKDFVVVVAGYKEDMKEFISSNPGLQSRFNKFYEFEDFNESELLTIVKQMASKSGYTLNTEVEQKFHDLFTRLYQTRDKTFGNGRLARNIFEKTIEAQANRIASIPELTEQILTQIEPADVPDMMPSMN
jgi:AAA+ superfamily predicted ATPase